MARLVLSGDSKEIVWPNSLRSQTIRNANESKESFSPALQAPLSF